MDAPEVLIEDSLALGSKTGLALSCPTLMPAPILPAQWLRSGLASHRRPALVRYDEVGAQERTHELADVPRKNELVVAVAKGGCGQPADLWRSRPADATPRARTIFVSPQLGRPSGHCIKRRLLDPWL